MEEIVNIEGSPYLYAKDYQDHEVLRKQMGVLCRNTWGFDFEKMYQGGSWEPSLHPYTLFHGDQAVSHSSVSEMDFCLDGEILHLVQLGTVMTDEAFRGKGLSRYLMERILDDFKDCDGMFLYANQTVLDFYPKFGFEPVNECPRRVTEEALSCFRERAAAVMQAEIFQALASEESEGFLLSLSENCKNGCGFYPVNNRSMVRFYLKMLDGFSIADMLYLLPDGQTVVLAEVSEDDITIHDVYSRDGCDIESVLTALITKNTKNVFVRLAYEKPYFEQFEECGADDLWLYVRGSCAENLKQSHVIFPMTTHT